jgi:antitoxin component of MazEF toxin-antitoxin module
MMTWTAYVQQDGNDIILPLPDELLAELKWKEGDVLVWEVSENGSVTLTKKIGWYERIIRYIKELKWRM